MRTLVLARHAKAEPHTGEQRDHARPLALRGRDDSRALAEAVEQAQAVPQVAYVSDSVRTTQTWKVASAGWETEEVHHRAELYNTTVGTLVAVLSGTRPDAESVMVVGHEPTVSAAAAWLAGPGSDKVALQRIAHGLPTGMAALFDVPVDWRDLAQGAAVLRAVIGRGE